MWHFLFVLNFSSTLLLVNGTYVGFKRSNHVVMTSKMTIRLQVLKVYGSTRVQGDDEGDPSFIYHHLFCLCLVWWPSPADYFVAFSPCCAAATTKQGAAPGSCRRLTLYIPPRPQLNDGVTPVNGDSGYSWPLQRIGAMFSPEWSRCTELQQPELESSVIVSMRLNPTVASIQSSFFFILYKKALFGWFTLQKKKRKGRGLSQFQHSGVKISDVRWLLGLRSYWLTSQSYKHTVACQFEKNE